MKGIKLLLFFSLLFAMIFSQNSPPHSHAQEGTEKTVGTVFGETEGYTLYKVNGSQDVYLIDGEGQIINHWHIDHPAREAKLRENGNIVVSYDPVNFRGPEASFDPPYAQFSEYTWDGELVWTYEFDLGPSYQVHHGIEVLPNGNIMFLAWEYKYPEEAIALGRDPEDIGTSLWPDIVYEYDPSLGEFVWEWHAWDHTVQDFDESLPNYGVISENPHRIDINFYEPGLRVEDWLHSNAIDYNPELDQIVISVREFNEVWIIDHSISTEEAKGPAGDLLYRWGNPRAYQQGTEDDRQLSFQHDAQWVPAGYPGEGNIIIFSNRHNFGSELANQAEELDSEAGEPYSKIVEFTPPLQEDGTYFIEDGQRFGPETPTWTYGENPDDYNFYSRAQSGVQRLQNGNTLIIQSFDGVLLEVTHDKQVAWEYVPPFQGIFPVMQGTNSLPNLFRARQYPPDYAALVSRDLTPDSTIEWLANSSADMPAYLHKGNTIDTFLTQERPIHYYVYTTNSTEILSFQKSSSSLLNPIMISIEHTSRLRVLEDPIDGTTKYIASPGSHFFYVNTTESFDNIYPYHVTLISTGDVFADIDEEIRQVVYGDNFTSHVTEEEPTRDYVFFGLMGDVIDINIERHYDVLEPVVSILDADQNLLINDSDEDIDGTAAINSFELPYSGVYYIHIEYDDEPSGPSDAGSGRYTFDFMLVSE